MDESRPQELQTSTWSNRYPQFFKKALQFLVSLSLFSFLLSYTSGISHYYFPYFNFHFSSLLFPLLSQALDRKYIFLICNGIVAVLAKSLSFTKSSSPSADLTEGFAKADEDEAKTVLETEAPVLDKEATMESAVESLENVSSKEEDDEQEQEKEKESRALITGTEGEEEDEDDEVEESGSLIPQSSAEDEGNEVNVSTEELNRKFEEFIRKMKEEIRIGAQQQLIAVESTSS